MRHPSKIDPAPPLTRELQLIGKLALAADQVARQDPTTKIRQLLKSIQPHLSNSTDSLSSWRQHLSRLTVGSNHHAELYQVNNTQVELIDRTALLILQ